MDKNSNIKTLRCSRKMNLHSEIQIPFVKFKTYNKYVKGNVLIAANDDLNELQNDMEGLLSNCSIRQRYLKALINGTPIDIPAINNLDQTFKIPKRPKLNPKPDVSKPEVELKPISLMDQFWNSKKEYFRKVTKDDLNYLDTLVCESLQGVSVEPKVKVAEKLPGCKLELAQSKCTSQNCLSETCKNICCEINRTLKELADVSANNVHNLMELRKTATKFMDKNIRD